MKHIVLITVLSFLLIGGICEVGPGSGPVYFEDMIGTYKANYDAGLVDSLVLQPDSLYIRYFITKDSIAYVDTGYWEFGHYNNNIRIPYIKLFGFRHRFPSDSPYVTIYSKSPDAKFDTIPRIWQPRVYKVGHLLNSSTYAIEIRRTYDQSYMKRVKY